MTAIHDTEPDAAAAALGAGTPKGTKGSKGGSGLLRYILVRFVLIFPTVFILITLVFFLMRVIGDPITAAQGGHLPPEKLQELIHQAGYDRPILVQYFDYIGGIFRGDFGTTISDHQPVSSMLATYGSATLELVVYGLVIALLIGIPLGMLAAKKRDRLPDAVMRVFAIAAYATPIFFLGLLLKLVFAVWLPVVPVSGRASTGTLIEFQHMQHPSGIYLIDALRLGDFDAAGDVLHHALLPAVALGLLTGGIFLRLVRTNMIGTFGSPYVEAGRSRGVREGRLLTRHAFRPALIPIITVMGMQIAMMLGGAVLTETTFGWEGLGFKLAHYLQARDFVAVQGIVALLAVIVALTNFVVDVVAALIDPRIRY